MPYTMQPIRYSVASTVDPAQPANFQFVLISAWIEFAAPLSGTWQCNILGQDNGAFGAFGGIQLNISPLANQVQIGPGGAQPLVSELVNFDTFAGAPKWHHVLMSIDSAGPTFQIYIDDVPLNIVGTVPDPYIPLPMFTYTNPPQFLLTFSPIAFANCQGDVYVDYPGSLYSLTDVSNRRKFIDAAGFPVFLGTDGSIPTGSPPVVFLTVPTGGVPTDFLINRGTGGGTFIVHPSGPPAAFCPGPIPPPSSVLSMDNVIVTSLATESPCTVQQFTTPPPTENSPSLGLRWSDTRGQTFGNAVPQQFSTDPLSSYQWNRTGYARDRVFELFWSAAFKTALNGAFVDVRTMKS